VFRNKKKANLYSSVPTFLSLNSEETDQLKQLLPIILESLESSSSSSSEDDDTITTIPRHLPKSRQYFDLIADMDNEEFFSHFRMGRG